MKLLVHILSFPFQNYIGRRILLMIPTLFGIMLINFIVIQSAPGGPVEQAIAELSGANTGALSNVGGGTGANAVGANAAAHSGYEFSRGIDPALIKELEKQFGFDKPAHVRFFTMMWNYIRFDFGESFFQDVPVVTLVMDRMPVSISLGLWTLLIVYSVSIPLGVRKAVYDGTPFDVWTSMVVLIGYAIPAFILAMLLIIVLCGGEFLDLFPFRGLTSDGFSEFSSWEKVKDYFWHITLPVVAMVAGSFATLTMLTKNSFLDEINKQYVLTAKAKGLTPKRVLYGHVFRNAMLIVIAGFPRALLGVLFTGVLLIEVIFSLNGLGLLGFEAILTRDYPIVFGTLFVFSLLGLAMQLVTDITYTLIDPRIDFEGREV